METTNLATDINVSETIFRPMLKDVQSSYFDLMCTGREMTTEQAIEADDLCKQWHFLSALIKDLEAGVKQ